MSSNTDKSLDTVLRRLLFTASLYIIDKHAILFYQGGIFTGDQPIRLVRQCLIELCGELKSESIALIDSIAPPDYVLNTPLGVSDGEAYKASYTAMVQSAGAFDFIGDIDDFMKKTQFGCLKSKL